ncbi:MAG TPA: hypothetical protein VHV83_00630 [Armatimonadota bacterium]|nr:hypothetical protein [Armatimonadota bacterium]
MILSVDYRFVKTAIHEKSNNIGSMSIEKLTMLNGCATGMPAAQRQLRPFALGIGEVMLCRA